MMVTFFHWRLKPGMRDMFVVAWGEVTDTLRAHGSLGSALFEEGDGTMRALARWPDAATRDAAFAAGVALEAGARMRATIAETLHRADAEALDNRWVWS